MKQFWFRPEFLKGSFHGAGYARWISRTPAMGNFTTQNGAGRGIGVLPKANKQGETARENYWILDVSETTLFDSTSEALIVRTLGPQTTNCSAKSLGKVPCLKPVRVLGILHV